MAYSSLAEVKEVLQIPTAETTWDTELTICITSADAIIDAKLQDYESSLPLASPPQIIKEASKYLAAGLFQERRQPSSEKPSLYDRGMTLLNDYMTDHYKDEIAFIVAEDEI